MDLTSSAFQEGGVIPSRYTCDGQDVSPPLAWSDVPEGTQSFALIGDDPDCPGYTFVHWLLYNLPGHRRELLENFSKEAELPDGTLQGMNDFGRIGYGGPCPPKGVHRYFFHLYALKKVLALPPRAKRIKLELAMKDHILAHARLMGAYRRAV